MKLNLAPAELIDQLRAWFHPKDRVITLSDSQWVNSKRVAWEAAVSKSLALPGLVGFWPMSSVQRSTGNAYDMSGQGRTLTYNGNPVYSVYKDFTPYIELDGTGDYLSRADETDLDILGSETIYASNVRGLTIGGWFWWDALGSEMAEMGKYTTTGNQRSYLIDKPPTNLVNFIVSTDGIATTTAAATTAVTATAWYFLVGRFTPSTELALFQNGTKYTNTVGIPASIFNGTAPLLVSGINAGALLLLNGRASLCFLCANALSDELILAKYYQERMLFQ